MISWSIFRSIDFFLPAGCDGSWICHQIEPIEGDFLFYFFDSRTHVIPTAVCPDFNLLQLIVSCWEFLNALIRYRSPDFSFAVRAFWGGQRGWPAGALALILIPGKYSLWWIGCDDTQRCDRRSFHRIDEVCWDDVVRIFRQWEICRNCCCMVQPGIFFPVHYFGYVCRIFCSYLCSRLLVCCKKWRSRCNWQRRN